MSDDFIDDAIPGTAEVEIFKEVYQLLTKKCYGIDGGLGPHIMTAVMTYMLGAHCGAMIAESRTKMDGYGHILLAQVQADIEETVEDFLEWHKDRGKPDLKVIQ